MKSKSIQIKKRKSRGDLLTDALFAMFICMIVALGLAYSISSAINNQARIDAQNDAILQMRNSIMSLGVSSICSGTAVPSVVLKNNVSLAVSSKCTNSSVSIGSSYSGTLQTVVLSVTSAQYFGSPGTVIATD